MQRTAADFVLKYYAPFLKSTQHELLYVGTKMPVPKFDLDMLRILISEATDVLRGQSSLIEIEPPVCIIGDIHGNLRDMLRIITMYFSENKYKFLFLGDYVDRGCFSLEVVTLLYALLVKYPQRFFLIRGNHEIIDHYKASGLMNDLTFSYNDTSLVRPIYNSFGWLPVACLIKGEILCLHGGLSPYLKTIDDIRNIRLPFMSLDDEMVSDILWSDPNHLISQYVESSRGRGKLFGQSIAANFLKENNLTALIRGHQCVADGINYFSENVITVFSSSYYNDEEENKAGCLLIEEDLEQIPVMIPAYRHGTRQCASFVDASSAGISKNGSMVYNEPQKMSSFSPIPTMMPIYAGRKKRRMSGIVSVKPMIKPSVTKRACPILPLPKISAQI